MDRVDVLVADGLPRALPGGLVTVAIHLHEVERLLRAREVGGCKVKCQAALASARAAAKTRKGSFTQPSTRERGRYDKKRRGLAFASGACCTDCVPDGSNAAAASALAESGDGGFAAELETPHSSL